MSAQPYEPYTAGGSYTPVGYNPGEADREPVRSKVPEFEGNKVARTKAQFTSTTNLEVEDEVYHLDEVKRFYVEAKVVNIHHRVNEKTGELDRVQVLKVVDVQAVTWNDPNGWKQ